MKPKDKKSAKIIALTNNHLHTGDTPEAVVNLLASLNDKASRGEITGIAVSWIEPQNNICTQIVQGSSSASSLVSGVTALFMDINMIWNKR